MGSINWQNLLSEIENLVVTGQHDKCKEKLDLINPHHIPRNLAPQFAELATRIHHNIYALKVLNPFVHAENTLAIIASDAEKKTYAYALTHLGAHDEAYHILNSMSVAVEPEVLFCKAMVHFGQWNYASAIPLLQDYIGLSSISPYRKVVGEVNLAAAYVCQEEYEQGLILLNNLILKCESLNYQLLLGNCLELKAQLHFFKSEFDLALINLSQSHMALQNQNGIYLFFVEKWRTICQAFKSRSNEDLEHLRNLRGVATEKNYWESLRELDLFEAILTNNEELARKVIMGTPSESYRGRVRKLFKSPLRPMGSFHWQLGESKSLENVFIFDPFEKTKATANLLDTPQLFLLCQALTLDFYKPSYIGALFKSIYPQEQFNPYTSPDRVMKLLKRLNVWFEAQNVPLRIHFRKSEFSLVALQPVDIIIKRGREKNLAEDEWSSVKKEFKGRHFTTEHLVNSLGFSKSTAQRLIKKGLSEGRLIASGHGRAVTYQFSTAKKNLKAA